MSGLLPPSPAPPGSGCPQLHRPAATGSAAKVSHLHSNHSASRRTHDLRHTFAVNNLRLWFAQGQDIGALLPVLQTYMGHSSLSDTAYYLHLTAESYPDITTQVQQAIGDVVPPATAGPRHGH